VSVRIRLGEFKALWLDSRARELLLGLKTEALRLLAVGGAMRADAIAGDFLGFFVRLLQSELAASDELEPWTLTKVLSDGVALREPDELVTRAFTKVLFDVVEIVDSFTRAGFYSESASHSASASDVLVLSFQRGVSDSATLSETALLNFLKALNEELVADDVLARSVWRPLADATTAADSLAMVTNHGLQSAVVSPDAGWVLNFSYGDFTYFAEPYVGHYQTF
jgi:hypothetical protein